MTTPTEHDNHRALFAEAAGARHTATAAQGRLKTAGLDGSATGMADDLTDAKIAAAEARVDTEFAKLRGELQRLPGKATIWGAAGSLFLGVLAVLSFGGDRLALGLSQADARQAQLARDAEQDRASRELRETTKAILTKLDQGRAAR